MTSLTSAPLRPAPPVPMRAPSPRPFRETDLRVSAALLVATELVERGWLQHDFFLARDRRDRPVRVGPMRLGMLRTDQVMGACLVGAVLYGANVEDPRLRHATDLPALDTCWDAMRELEGYDAPSTPPGSHPAVRRQRVRELTAWNDARGRTQSDVTELLGVAVRRRSSVSALD